MQNSYICQYQSLYRFKYLNNNFFGPIPDPNLLHGLHFSGGGRKKRLIAPVCWR